jgi:hypothetical protein
MPTVSRIVAHVHQPSSPRLPGILGLLMLAELVDAAEPDQRSVPVRPVQPDSGVGGPVVTADVRGVKTWARSGCRRARSGSDTSGPDCRTSPGDE